MTDPREYDVVVFGATGFVGALTAAHLAEQAPPAVAIALAGRSRSKLEQTRAGLPGPARDWPLIVADTADPRAMAELAASTRVLVTTVGPYARYGLAVVAACAAAGTHYADLTGEVLFVREAIDGFDAAARESGARLVHSCGYDSIPSDLGMLMLHQRAVADGAGEILDAQLVATARGGVSGGTVDSLRAQLEAVAADPSLRRVARHPHSLSPDRDAEPERDQPADAGPPARGPGGGWTAPFVMAPFNTRIVRRSNALQDWAYGRPLRYGEVMGTGRGPAGAATAVAVTAGLGAFVAGMSARPARRLLDRVLPAPGAGPDAQARDRGWFRSVIDARTASGRRYRATVAGPGDPGYAATAVMLGQAALCLAEDALPDRAGSLTPATALGAPLIERLRAAGHTYEVAPA